MVDVCFEDVVEVDLSAAWVSDWFDRVGAVYSKSVGEITIVLCSDDFLLEMNQQHLAHDYFTDIITFDYSFEDTVSGDLFISVERVLENSNVFQVSFEDELHRVCVHGLLHLCGLKDKSEEDEAAMRVAEDMALALRFT